MNDLRHSREQFEKLRLITNEGIFGGRFTWQKVASKLRECLRDERGSAMTEYLIVVGITLPLVFYLFNPDNGFYQNAREQYELTMLMLWAPVDHMPGF